MIGPLGHADPVTVHCFDGWAAVPSSLAAPLTATQLPATMLAGRPGELLLPPGGRQLIFAARHGSQWLGAVACDIVHSQRLRALQVLRVRRLPADLPPSVQGLLVQSVVATAQRSARIRRVIVTVAGEPAAVHQTCRELLAAGFVAPPLSSVPPRTVMIGLDPTPAALLSAAGSSPRRALRNLDALPLEFRSIETISSEPRMQQLLENTFANSKGVASALPLRGMIRAAAEHPAECSLIGCFLKERAGTDALIAWEFATRQRSIAVSECAAMERVRPNGRTIPAGYGTLWHSIRWAAAHGATHFDLGGFTVPGDPGHETFASISRFKSHFGGEIVEGREAELQLTPRTPMAQLSLIAERLVGIGRR